MLWSSGSTQNHLSAWKRPGLTLPPAVIIGSRRTGQLWRVSGGDLYALWITGLCRRPLIRLYCLIRPTIPISHVGNCRVSGYLHIPTVPIDVAHSLGYNVNPCSSICRTTTLIQAATVCDS